MAKRKSKVGFLGLSNTTLLLIGGGIALYYLTRPKKENVIGSLDNKNDIIKKIKSYKIPFRQFNQDPYTKERIEDWKNEYGDVSTINEMVARELLYRIGYDLFNGVEEVDFRNYSKKPQNHFQMVMDFGDYIIYTGPFVYVDDNHKVVAKRTQIEILNSDWDLIATLK